MPWKVTNVLEQRISFVVRALHGRESMSALCREFGISRQTGYKWLKRYREIGGFAQLQGRSRRPHNSPNRTPPEIEERVIELRKHYGWGGKKLHVLLAREGIDLSIVTINRIISRNGLVAVKDSHRPATKRFERERPNELWQMDFKGQFRIQEGHCYPLSILDDHSRFAVGLYALDHPRAVPVIECLTHTFEEYGVPQAMLIDHGSPWWSTTNTLGLTGVAVYLMKQGIHLYHSGVRHPQTQGKVERFHGTLQAYLDLRGKPSRLGDCRDAFSQFRYEYNHIRPHEGIGMAVPADRYGPSSKQYDPNPPPWEYPPGSLIERLNTQGCLDHCGRRYFVCEALASEPVRVQVVEGKLLVNYRDMYIREIDTETGRTSPVLRAVPA